MRFIVKSEAMVDAMRQMASVAPRRSIRPELGCVLIEAGDHAARLYATNGELSLSMRINAVDAQVAGSVLIPAAMLGTVVQQVAGDGTMTIEQSGDGCAVRDEESVFKLFGYKPSDLPPQPVISDRAKGFSCRVGDIAPLLARSRFAMSDTNTRYAVAGMLVKRTDKAVDVVAVEGCCMCLSRMNLRGGDPFWAILPANAIDAFLRIATDPDEQVTISLDDNRMFFALSDRATLTSPVIDGTFPPYEDVIPKNNGIVVTAKVETMAAAIKRASILASEHNSITFDFKKDGLVLRSRRAEVGDVETRCELVSITAPIEIKFNPKFWLGFLAGCETEVVEIKFDSPLRPCVANAGQFKFVAAPINKG